MMKKGTVAALSFLTVMLMLLTLAVPFSAAGVYIHDPMENPKAAADIVVDPDAVYGYAPNPASPRLGGYAEYDFSDEAVVAEMKQQREAYHDSVKELYQIKADMEAQGKSVEEIARAVSTRRNEIRMEAYQDDPEGLEKLKESNLATYGNENGGTPDYFFEKYGSWETVIEKSFSTNAGADAVLGLYDKYYDTYIFDKPAETDESQNDDEGETDATEATEAASIKPTEHSGATADQSMKSPNTGDYSIVFIRIILIASGVAVLCICIAVKQIGTKAKAD